MYYRGYFSNQGDFEYTNLCILEYTNLCIFARRLNLQNVLRYSRHINVTSNRYTTECALSVSGTCLLLSHLHPAARQFCRSTYTITDITIK
jgi:hypothetical protein